MNENEHEHIIQFEYDEDLDLIFKDDDSDIISRYSTSKNIHFGFNIDIYYNNLSNYGYYLLDDCFYIIFNISNMLYKIHTKEYYCKYNHNCKELI